MPEFFVEFDRVVTYLPDHPKANRPVTGLVVSAPTPTGAMQHALRTTRGEAEIVETKLADEADPDKVGAARAQLPYRPPAPVPVEVPLAETPRA